MRYAANHHPHRTLSAEMTYLAPGGSRGTGRSRAGCSDPRDTMIRYRLAAQAGKWRWQWYVVVHVCQSYLVMVYRLRAGNPFVLVVGRARLSWLPVYMSLVVTTVTPVACVPTTTNPRHSVQARRHWCSCRPISGTVELSCDTCSKMHTVFFFFYDSRTG